MPHPSVQLELSIENKFMPISLVKRYKIYESFRYTSSTAALKCLPSRSGIRNEGAKTKWPPPQAPSGPEVAGPITTCGPLCRRRDLTVRACGGASPVRGDAGRPCALTGRAAAGHRAAFGLIADGRRRAISESRPRRAGSARQNRNDRGVDSRRRIRIGPEPSHRPPRTRARGRTVIHRTGP